MMRDAALVVDEFDSYISAFESAHHDGSCPNLADFLPPEGHPLREKVLPELVRVDLEWSWRVGRRRRLVEYEDAFPELFKDPEIVAEIAFEEYRQRCLAGDNASADEYHRRYHVDTSGWPSRADTDLNETPRSPPPAPPVDLHLSTDNQETAQLDVARIVPPKAAFPSVGSRFLDFELKAELGSGAFARVYLARQLSLAGRLVALKISVDSHGEPQKLAKLQHTNIVPIFSAHQDGPFHALCMPYFGAASLDRILRRVRSALAFPKSGRELVDLLTDPKTGQLPSNVAEMASSKIVREQFDRMTYVEAVVWIAARLASGLAHAHERGILHRDIKPANILLSDDGQPMLLDFNVSTGAGKVRHGGTPMYMAPEQLENIRQGMRHADVRSDLYALGLVLFELLIGQFPFPVKQRRPGQLLGQLLVERQGPPPSPARFNPAISPAVDAIVRRLLEPDPHNRYQSARELQEDLDAHLANQPLRHMPEPSWGERVRKWRRRHPRFASALAVAAVAGLFVLLPLTMLVIRNRQATRAEAITTMVQSREEFRAVEYYTVACMEDPRQRELGAEQGRAILNRYHVIDDPHWMERAELRRLPEAERRQFTAELGELLLLMSDVEQTTNTPEAFQVSLQLNQKAEECLGAQAPAALWKQRAELLSQLGRQAEADELRQRPLPLPVADLDQMQEALDRIVAHEYRAALEPLKQLTQRSPKYHRAWFDAGHCYFMLGQFNESAASFSVCIALHPESPWALYYRALCWAKVKEDARALVDFDRAIELKPDNPDFLVNRAISRGKVKDMAGAEADFARALELGDSPARVHLLRSRIRREAGDNAGADADLAEGLRHAPHDADTWFMRGLARMETDPEGALADYNEALKLNPRMFDSLRNKAHVLAEKLKRTEGAIAVLNTMLEYYPDSMIALGGRGVYHARLGHVAEARRDAAECYRRDKSAFGLYQQASLYAQLSKHDAKAVDDALRLFAESLQRGFTDLQLIKSDEDMNPIRDHPQFRKLMELARELHAAAARGRAEPR
ncbi:MAG TPA: protein kinase [Gemmataceae bacterium]|jgi:serine/threonine protein kinase/tetratricopeptide (TPR) repeat protein|nr:protein kinase [Gemmataceae bacterium]